MMRNVSRAVAVLAVALLVRALWAAYVEANPLDGRFDDSLFYHFAAASLARGDGYVSFLSGEATALFPPGYPFFLAGLYRVFGVDPSVGEAANVVLGALTCVLVFALATALFGERVGLLAGLALAVFPGQALFVPALMSEVLFTFLLLSALLMAVLLTRAGRWRLPLAAAVGVVSGLAALVRGEGLLVILIVMPFWAVALASARGGSAQTDGRPAASGGDWRRALRTGAVALAAALLVVLPWSVRNYVVMDEPILMSTNIGGNLFMGRFAGTWERVLAVDELRQPHLALTPREQELAMNRDGWREGMKLALTKPWREARIFPPKLKALYDRDDDFLLHVEGFGSGRRLDEPLRGALQVTANSYYFAMVGLALVGGALAARLSSPKSASRRQPAAVLLLSAVAVWTVAETLMLADSRYHFPLIPVLAVLAGLALSAAFERATELRLRARSAEGRALSPALEPADTARS